MVDPPAKSRIVASMNIALLLEFREQLQHERAKEHEAVEAKYRRASEDVSKLIKSFGGKNGQDADPVAQSQSGARTRGRPGPLADMLREAIRKTPAPFSLNEIEETLSRIYPTVELTRKVISSGLSRMAARREIIVDTKGSGVFPTTYKAS